MLVLFFILFVFQVPQFLHEVEIARGEENRLEYGFIGDNDVCTWYLKVFRSGMSFVFLTHSSTVFPTPINILYCFDVSINGTEALLINELIGIEFFRDPNNDSVPSVVDSTTKEIDFFLLFNASRKSIISKPEMHEEKIVWNITYLNIQGHAINTLSLSPEDQDTVFEVIFDRIIFTFELRVKDRVARLKMGLILGKIIYFRRLWGNITLLDEYLDECGVSYLFSTKVYSKEGYGILLDSLNKPTNITILLRNETTVFQTLFNTTYFIEKSSGTLIYNCTAGIYSLETVDPQLVESIEYFDPSIGDELNDLLDSKVAEKLSIKVADASFVYRLVFPKWGNKTIYYDPEYIAYFTPIKASKFLNLILVSSTITGAALITYDIVRYKRFKKHGTVSASK